MLFIFAFLRISSSLATFGFVSYPWLHFNTFGYCNGNNYWIMMHFTRPRKGSQRGREGLVCLMQAMLLWKTRICSQGRLKQNKVKRLVYFWKFTCYRLSCASASVELIISIWATFLSFSAKESLSHYGESFYRKDQASYSWKAKHPQPLNFS